MSARPSVAPECDRTLPREGRQKRLKRSWNIEELVELIQKYADTKLQYYPPDVKVPVDVIVNNADRAFVVDKDKDGNERVNRINYEISTLQVLRETLRSRKIWVPGSGEFQNPDADLPSDFTAKRSEYDTVGDFMIARL